MMPNKRLLTVIALVGLLLLVHAILLATTSGNSHNVVQYLGQGLVLIIVIICTIDFILGRRHSKRITAQRLAPNSLALGVNNDITLQVENPLSSSLHCTITDFYPDAVEAQHIPRLLKLQANNRIDVRYTVIPLRRGDADFGFIHLRILSPLKLWQFQATSGQKETVKIYPNFRSISHLKTMGLHHHVKQLGVHVKPRRGQGLNFHQLREFQQGDSLNQIDWKATSRLRKPISREFQDERDQDIIFLLDCGRRMHAKEGLLSHFDHVLNAFLLTSHIALAQGDAVGLMTFAGAHRWIPPVKGEHNINTLLNHVYDLHSGTDTNDFSEAAQHLLNRHRKRSLMIMVTNVHTEDSDDLKAAVQLLSKRHLILIANLREQVLDQTLTSPISHFDSALNYAATVDLMLKHQSLLTSLRKQGVFVADSLPSQLHVELIKTYLLLKRSGKI